ncbi:APC family permease [Bifidobacterium cuniculi]|uniref:Amino acid transporter n=1 Tax=Bifidobacterium cuniculi TaxID=1688 RepID=A0A087B2J2_9BIFI|nr:APC family permease [Bifidobacterium cuniculi]KFI65242.1 amino acid transporter [Bifidobacterium cuniculi]
MVTNPKPAAAAQGASAASAVTAASADTALKRTLTTKDLIVFGMIFMVPIAPFSILASVAAVSNGMPAIAYLIAMVAMLFTALSFGMMVPLFPSSGSIYVYASHEMSHGIGFVVGWLMILQYLITPAIMLIMAANALHEYIPGVPTWVWCVIFLAVITAIALRGTGATVLVDKLALAAELVVLALFFVFGIIYVCKHPETAHFSGTAFFNPSKFNMSDMMSAVSLCALSYVGFGSIVTLDNQSVQPKKGPRKAMIIIVLILGFLYMSMSFLTMCMDPSGNILVANQNTGFYEVAGLAGKWLGVVCAVANALALGLFTSLSGMTAISSLMNTMAQGDALPKFLARTGKKNGVPVGATLFTAGVSLVLIFVFDFLVGQNEAAKLSNFGALSTYFMLNLVVIWGLGIKGRQYTGRTFWRSVLCPLIGAAVTFYIFVSLGVKVWIVGVIWTVLGIVYYLVWSKGLHHTVDLEQSAS